MFRSVRLARVHVPRLSLSSASGGGPKPIPAYSVLKSQGGMNVKVIPPAWKVSNTDNSMCIHRPGGLYLEFSACSAPSTYDFGKKLSFFMGPTECGTFLHKTDVQQQFELNHNIASTKKDVPAVSKSLKFAPTPDGFTATFTASSHVNSSVSVPLSWSEVAVLRSVIAQGLPNFLGFDAVWKQGVLVNPEATPLT